MANGSREEAESSLVSALSRQIGYTAGAYDLSRIVSILDGFAQSASLYKQEIVSSLASLSPAAAGESYLLEVINFSQSLGLTELVSGRDATLQRIAPTELGRSLLGARSTQNEPFYRFLLAKIVLLADSDYLFPVLEWHAGDRIDGVQDHFTHFISELRRERWSWLLTAFPERMLRERIAEQLSWLSSRNRLGERRIEELSASAARHRTTPRIGWLRELGMLSPDGRPSQLGRDVLFALAPEGQYFWLGPRSDAQSSLGVAEQIRQRGPFVDEFELAHSVEPPSISEAKSLVDEVTTLMLTAYDKAKLVHAAQASLILPVEYVGFARYRDERDYSWERILDDVFQASRGTLERFSARKGQIGFYRPIR